MRKVRWGCYLAILLVGASVLHACASSREMRATEAVASALDPGSIQGEEYLSFDTGPLEDGWAVLYLQKDAAFWFKDGEVYAVNEQAREIAPGAKPAPAAITYDAVKAVAR